VPRPSCCGGPSRERGGERMREDERVERRGGERGKRMREERREEK
jgi:hypothetical protein